MATQQRAPQRVAVVTDSTSYLPVALSDALGVRLVALQVQLDGRTGQEGRDVSPADVTAALRNRTAVTTSRPTPAEFLEVYRCALREGAEAVVSVHLSAELSGTCDSARLAAAELDEGVVRVLDSRSTAMALGFAVLAAARAAAAGAGAEAVEQAARAARERTSALFYVDSLEWLHRGGRIGTAAAMLGTALAVKPLLHLADGKIVPLEKVRTASKAIARLVQLTVNHAGSGEVDIAVQHLASPERAADVARQLREALPNLRELHQSEVGAVVGAHVGPGLLGVVVNRL
ncbi:DegV family protein [Jatrophihabitans lederbergiae]|uniref:DegV family protein n=1 Tax=Jatrophihabitans lederbergiae TaxID=3075547 RepID=A0ABU2J6Q7_9ACTN|nr:DegV family protein [Jatrophihabitans sp. DSM 44399]MDT0260383.1 DegV family protein [Jatrophihabitans sp. DSM 44399]